MISLCSLRLSFYKFSSVPARWPEPNAGVARHVGESIFCSWLFWFFLCQDKKNINNLTLCSLFEENSQHQLCGLHIRQLADALLETQLNFACPCQRQNPVAHPKAGDEDCGAATAWSICKIQKSLWDETSLLMQAAFSQSYSIKKTGCYSDTLWWICATIVRHQRLCSRICKR